MDDQYFLQSLIKGDNVGIGNMYTQLYPKVKSYILKRDGNEEEAKDIMQKALLQLSVRAQDPNFTIASTFEGYFMTICKNLWIREAKKLKLRVTNDTIFTLLGEDEDLEIAMSTYEQEKWELFREKLHTISENCKELLLLFFNKTPYKKIAAIKKYASENTVKQRIFKCKAKLKEAIQADKRYKDLLYF